MLLRNKSLPPTCLGKESLPHHPQTTLEAADNTYREIKEQRRRAKKHLGKIVASGIMALPASVVTANLSYLTGERQALAADVSCGSAPDPADVIPGYSAPTPDEIATDEADQVSVVGTRSAATQFKPTAQPTNQVPEYQDKLLIPSNFEIVLSQFQMESSGINVVVRTDSEANIDVNKERIEEIFNLPMINWHRFQSRSVRDLMWCANQEILVQQARRGKTLNIYLPSLPNVCPSGIYAVGFNEGEKSQTCGAARGGTLPSLRLPITGTCLRPMMVFVSAARNNKEIANNKIDDTLAHELWGHVIPGQMNCEPLLHDDEEAADYIELRAGSWDDSKLGPAFRYN